MNSSRRQLRVARVIRDIVSEAIGELQDPRIKSFVSVNSVELSPDLRYADVFLSCFGVSEEESRLSFKAITHARGFIQSEIAGELQMRFCPLITLHQDIKQDQTNETLKIIDKISKELHQNDSDDEQKPEDEE
ncbi:30S ribosome-binding factor RbfA [Sedimentisphaera salicampi]|uniref:Ribosome-binding factor A n=1 Tax=Sedimentisphaera salicampi TaxID=1941349 RepID=A0A1W6LNL8_9BACT|nr:30S ribosome-binding factor RbfA [Sedimentisphaera salicampi]ARN57385.1 Ribosome-binding factor A [Sedimentisphaera salicampi]OXU14525.1 Ribosome-binding factor A [Sedimentisphaera salicampi]